MVKAVEYDAEHGAKRQESEGRRVSKKCPKCGGEISYYEVTGADPVVLHVRAARDAPGREDVTMDKIDELGPLEHTRPEQLRRLRATASLIAAAPDLLRSLDEIVEFIELGGSASSMRRTHNAMLKSGGPDTSMIGKAKAALKRTRFREAT